MNDDDGLTRLLRIQDGVIARRQVLELGLREHDLRRMIRRRELTTVHPGVFVDHTGQPPWEQRSWAAVLVHWPAALTRESALPTPAPKAPIQVAIDVRRSVRPVPGVDAHRTPQFTERVRWLKSPPRVAIEHAAIDVAAAAPDELAAYQTFADVCQSRQTSPALLAATLATRPRVRRGIWLRRVVADLEAGACSVLEHGYLTRVERAHGLPTGSRQADAVVNGRAAFRDVEYREFATIVELDGRPFHDTARARDRDFERDLEAAVEGGSLTVRLTYGQVYRDACRTAVGIGALLQRRGWTGAPTRCPDCPDS